MTIDKTSLDAQLTSESMALTGPIRFEGKKKKKKKKTYSSKLVKRTAKYQDAELKGIHRLVHAADRGVSSWRKERDKSGRKRRDGAIRDGLRNRAKAMEKFAREAAKAPSDVVKGVRRPPALRRGAAPSAYAPRALPLLGLVGVGAESNSPPPPLRFLARPLGPDPAVIAAVAAGVAMALGNGRAPTPPAPSRQGLATTAISAAVAAALASFRPPAPPPPTGPLLASFGPGPGPFGLGAFGPGAFAGPRPRGPVGI